MLTNSPSRLLLGTILGSIHVSAWSQTTVSTTITTPLNTQSAGDITVTEDGSIEVSSGTPVTINSAAKLQIDDVDEGDEAGNVETGEGSGVTGVLVTTNSSFSISNGGTIQVLEDFIPDDEDGNGIADGAIAEGINRAGIRITSDASGSVYNEGTISVEGLNSYGIVAGNNFTGNITNEGYIYTLGDYSKGISTGSVNGDLDLKGQILSAGEGAQALVVGGDVTGAVRIQGTVGQQTTFTNDDGASMSLSRGDLRIRAPAVEIGGSVAGGILIAARPYDLDEDNDDEDNDGIDDVEEGSGSVRGYGVSPALYIGSPDETQIGGAKGRDGTFSLAIDGSVTASATYSSISTVGVEIGGQGSTVLAQGIGVSGTVEASTYDSHAIAVLLNESAVVPSLYNSGTISAKISSPGDGGTIAIQDKSGTLTSIENSGTINAGGSREDVKVALDLRNAASGVTVLQYLNDLDADTKADEADEDDYDPDNPTIYTAIYGDLLLSKLNDKVDVSSGGISGHTYFYEGNDSLSVSDDAVYSGNVYGGTGQLSVNLSNRAKFYGTIDAGSQDAVLNIFDQASYAGTFANAENLSVNVQGGKLKAKAGEVASFSHLDVGSGGAIAVVIDGEDGTSSSFDVATASFAEGSKVQAEVTSIANADGSYQILTANQIVGAPTFDREASDIPLLYNADLNVDIDGIILTIQRKTAAELGFNAAQASAYEPVIAMLGDQSTLEASILQASALPELQRQFQELLPDYSGGVFQFATRASQLASARLQTETHDFFNESNSGMWFAPYYFRSKLSGDESEDVTMSGKGFAGAFEVFASRGTFGLDVSFTRGAVTNGSRQDLKAGLLELGAYYRRLFGPIYTFARVSGGTVNVDSSRSFTGAIDDEDFTYEAKGSWKGLKLAGMAGANAKLPVSTRLSFIPALSIDYQQLREKAYDETGDDAILLGVDERSSSRLSAFASVTSSFRLARGFVPLTLDLQAGRRVNLVEKLGETTAAFTDGDPFSIASISRGGVWHAEAKVHGGASDGTWSIAAGADKGVDEWSASVRAMVSLAF